MGVWGWEIKTRTQAVWCLLATAALWSTGGILVKMISLNPMAIAGSRSALAATCLFFLAKRSFRFNLTWPQLGGALAYAVTVVMYVLATKMTTAANAVLLLYTAPVYVAVLAPLWLGEPTRRLDWLFIFLSVGGMCLFFLDRLTASGIWGNSFAIISGVSFGSLAVLLRKQKDASPLDSIILGNVIAALACLPFMEFTLPGLKDGVWLFILGIFQLALPYVLFAEAARRVQALEVILIPMVEPILNPVWVILFYGEIPGFWATIGGVLVLGLVAARAGLTVRLPDQ